MELPPFKLLADKELDVKSEAKRWGGRSASGQARNPQSTGSSVFSWELHALDYL